MANKLIYPSFNPLQMFDEAFIPDARYNSKDFEDFHFGETILPWQQQTRYKQPWQKNDTIALQLQTNVGPVNWILKKCDGTVVNTLAMVQKQQSVNEPGLFIYELSAPLAGYAEGDYYIELQFGAGPVFTVQTGELLIKTLHENTLLLEAKHYENREDIIFETGFFPSVRVHATKKFISPKRRATVYEDQVLNTTSLRAQKYRTWNLRIGGTEGIPDYFADMIGSWIGCSDFRIDGKSYVPEANAEFEPAEIDDYPMRGWSIELRERFTKGSRTYENQIPIEGTIAIAVNSDSKGFGNSNTGDQTIMIDVT